MSTHFFYVDESYDEDKFCLVALGIRDRDWKACFDQLREFRRQLKATWAIRLHKETHAAEFVRGQGNLGPRVVAKRDRNRIFREFLQQAAMLPSAMLINVCLPAKGLTVDAQLTAWDRLINRIERTMKHFEDEESKRRSNLILSAKEKLDGDLLNAIEVRLKAYKPRAFIIADEGRETEITKALRRMHVFNPIPSQYGAWESGKATKNIVAERIIEDPTFKESHRSYFLQLADAIAFALLKKESPAVTPLVERFKLNEAFEETVAGICYRKASPSDPLGIVRK